MNLQGLVQAPRLWVTDPRADRRVTWMELFFDLIFVAAVAEVGSPLRADYSWPGLLRYSLLFVLIWWAWSGHTLYSTRFDHDDLVQRGLILLQCFIAAVMAANAKEALDSRSSAGFGAAYAGMRIVLVLQYVRARRVPETRPLTTRYAIGFGAAAVLWIVSALLEVPGRYWVWALALAVDFLTPWLAVKHSMKFPPDATHFPERFGLFTIILLGEFVAAVMRGIESQEYWSFSAAATAFSSMAFAFVLRWWYFDVGQSASERHVRSKRHAILFQVWHYAHLPLFLGIGVAGVGFERMISLQSGGRLTGGESWVLCSAVAVLMAALISIGATSESSQKRRNRTRYMWAQYGLIGIAGFLGFTAVGIPRVILVAGLLAACTAQTLLGRSALLAPKLVSRKASYPVPILAQPLNSIESP
jgi:low temperature requirement protein LtrA